MASSQVQIASNSPFGYVLKDRNRHDHRYRTMDSNAFEKNLKDLVQTHLNSCISGHSRNSGSGFIDYTDLWVHHPQNANHGNDIHSQNSDNSRMSGHPDPNDNSHRNVDYTDMWVHNPQRNENTDLRVHIPQRDEHTDLWVHNPQRKEYTDLLVHNPQRNDNENSFKKTKAGQKWEKAREMVFAFERKIQESSSGPVSDSQKVKKQDNTQPVQDLTSKRGKSPDSQSSAPVSTLQRETVRDHVSSGPVSTSQRGKIQDSASSGPVSTSQRATIQDAASSGPGSTFNVGRSTENSLSVPASTSQRGRKWEVISSRLFPFSQRGKNEEGMPSGNDLRVNSSVRSESSMEVSSLRGVSSLVQKWRDFEAEAKSLTGTNSPVCTSWSNSVSFCTDNERFADAPPGGSDACEEFVDLSPATPTKSEDLFLDWESDQTGLSGPPSTRGRDSDATENERIRVADIIRKLTSNGEDHNDREPSVSHESLPRVRTSVDTSERCFSSVSSSPRIRGRQAFADLLMQMERDRHRELEGLVQTKAVSKFSHRGRIQAMLRVRFLRNGACQGKDGRLSTSTSSESNRLAQSAITHIRKKFNVGIHHCQTDLVDKGLEGERFSMIHQEAKENHQQELAEPAKSLNVLDKYLDAQKPVIENPVGDVNLQEPNTTVQQNALQGQKSEIFLEEDHISSEQGTRSESSNHNKPDFTINQGNECSELEGSKNQHLIGSSNEFMNEITNAQGDNMEEEDTNQDMVVSEYIQETDVYYPSGGWEELHDCYEQQVETNQDWISDVSRPHSTWEDLRQARYQEMLDPFQENDDIRQLLQRKSVSSFLSSGLRECIDLLMMSRTQQPNLLACQIKKEERKNDMEEQEAAQKVRKQEEVEKELGGGRGDVEEESKDHNDHQETVENDIRSTRECNESPVSASQATSWDHNQDQEASHNYFEPASIPSPREPHTSNSSSETQQSSSFTNHSSMEKEFMYEMRGNMEQLHQEISELRRSIKSCINMQMKLQESITQDTKSGSSHSGRKKRKDSSVSKKSSRGRCCICYEMQIDSLLYRCGHMCTCFKCAHDLQWSSGKCPICEAPIIDVVRAYPCS